MKMVKIPLHGEEIFESNWKFLSGYVKVT